MLNPGVQAALVVASICNIVGVAALILNVRGRNRHRRLMAAVANRYLDGVTR